MKKKQLFYIKEVRNWNIGIKEKGEKNKEKRGKKEEENWNEGDLWRIRMEVFSGF